MPIREPLESWGRGANVRALFRVDAGPDAGLGHVQRCLALAEALRRFAVDSVFLTMDDPVVYDRLSGSGGGAQAPFHHEAVQQGNEVEQAVEAARTHGCTVVIVDSYHVGVECLRALRAAGLFVIAIDDVAREPFPCHLVVNGGAHAAQLPYRSTTDTRFLLGPLYALLHPAFWEVVPHADHGPVKRLLVTLGGSDPGHLLPLLLETLETAAGEFSVTAIVGPYVDHQAEIERAAECGHRPVRLLRAPSSLRDVMLDTDLAISAGGQTLYELARMGIPTVALQVADNQAGNLRAMACAGAIEMVRGVRDVRAAVEQLVARQDARMRLSAAGRELVDGQGAMRVARIIAERN